MLQARPGRFVRDEPYIAKAAVATHRETLHFRDYFRGVNDLAERTALVLDPANVA